MLAQEHPALAATYDAQLDDDLAAIEDGRPKAEGVAGGASVGDQIVALRQNDGSTPNETQPGGTGPGEFRASWSGVQFRNLVPFAIEDPSPYVTFGPPSLISAEYAADFAEVKTLGSAAIPDPEALEIFPFWASSAGSSQPPGEWIYERSLRPPQRRKPMFGYHGHAGLRPRLRGPFFPRATRAKCRHQIPASCPWRISAYGDCDVDRGRDGGRSHRRPREGADDYLPKPFELRELLARIRAVLRRAQARAPSPPKRNPWPLYRSAGWELDMRTRCLRSPEGAPVALTRSELCLLAAFPLRAGARLVAR